jgi:ATP-dependent Clp protease protease subunit
MLPNTPVGQWPPEVPPYRPPTPPTEPPSPAPAPPQPEPILPTWEEYEPLRRDLVDRLLEQRIILVTGDLGDDLANRTISQLLVLGRGRDPIELQLTCEHSELGAALTLADAIDLVRPPVKGLVRGVLRGPAVAALCACEHRAAHRHALFVLSLPETSVPAGTTTDVVHLEQQLKMQEAQLRARIVAATGRGDDDVAEDLRAGRFLTADEAREYGLLHEVV